MLGHIERIMLKHSSGLSLIELLITLTILGFMLAMGAPALSQYVANSRVRAVASDAREGLQLARMEAIRQNTAVSFCTSTTLGTGWEVRSGSDCSAGTVLRSKPSSASEAASVTLAPTSLSITFGADGRTRTSTGAVGSGVSLTTLDASWKNSCSGDCMRMRVEISPGGMIRTCNRDMAAGDPQACN